MTKVIYCTTLGLWSTEAQTALHSHKEAEEVLMHRISVPVAHLTLVPN